MFLRIETGDLINVGLLDRVVFLDKEKTALGYTSGILISGDSATLYRYFTEGSGRDAILDLPAPAPKAV